MSQNLVADAIGVVDLLSDELTLSDDVTCFQSRFSHLKYEQKNKSHFLVQLSNESEDQPIQLQVIRNLAWSVVKSFMV